MLDHDAARMLLGARRLDEAAARAHASAEAFRGIDEIGGASDADVLRAEILLTADQAAPAEAAARLALTEVPPGGYTKRIAKALATGGELSVISEIKRRSPSKGDLFPDLVPGDLPVPLALHLVEGLELRPAGRREVEF